MKGGAGMPMPIYQLKYRARAIAASKDAEAVRGLHYEYGLRLEKLSVSLGLAGIRDHLSGRGMSNTDRLEEESRRVLELAREYKSDRVALQMRQVIERLQKNRRSFNGNPVP